VEALSHSVQGAIAATCNYGGKSMGGGILNHSRDVSSLTHLLNAQRHARFLELLRKPLTASGAVIPTGMNVQDSENRTWGEIAHAGVEASQMPSVILAAKR
jgi:hypothetical protein